MTDRIMKKQSILNLVNSILLLATLLFSVISFAWYSPNKDVGTPLSFGAGNADGNVVLSQLLYDDAGVLRKDTTTNLPITTLPSEGTYLGQSSMPLVTATLLEFGTIDDLGYLKNSNCVFYCLALDASLGKTVSIDISYTTENLDNDDYHFSIYDADNALIDEVTVNGDDLPVHSTAAGYENFEASPDDPEVHTFVNYEWTLSNVAPDTFTTFAAIDAIFTADAPTMLSETTKTADIPSDTITGDLTDNTYYLYIKLYPNLNNYDELAMLMLDHMPFQMAFGIKLFIAITPDNS